MERHRKKPWRRVLSALLMVLSVLVAVVLAVFVYVIAVPRVPEQMVPLSVLVSGYGLYLVAAALVGLVLAGLTFWSGARKTGGAVAVVAAVALVFALVPVASSWETARDHGASLSLPDYLAYGPNVGRPVESLSTVYNRVDGEELELDVKLPPGEAEEPRPAVVWVHGGGWNIGDRGEVPKWHKWLNDRGYAVFPIDYRLAPPPRWNQAPADVKCAVGWVKQHAEEYAVDPSRVMVAGGSAGGNLALMGAYADDRVEPSCDVTDTGVAAVAAFYPAIDPATVWRETGSPGQVRPWVERYTGGSPDEVPDRYEAASPYTYVRPGLPPTLIMHGARDHIAPHDMSAALADRLDQLGVPNRLVTLPYTDHVYDFVWGDWGSQISRHTFAEFLEEHFPS
ncbi:acetyl esterase/lipase [Nocardiopsis mwathae]|uniref:Acetyl esterase/lipase n=1 Tax=Nocardiopsis mwathae TaxID=1472723 RepID=A0A7W9YEE0_9ACTN|nr:alpha/beta hydrolase [Nocardiopsis mwathae]MBB6170623.1 acetyl esterase/lipase [Nocardiopsis mwathae]